MIIQNIRLGFANNSSSSHSLIFLEAAQTSEWSNFGWDFFTAADDASKRNYLGALVYDNIRPLIGEEAAQVVARELTSSTSAFGYDGAYIDHESVLTLPMDWTGKFLHLGFLAEFERWLLQSNVVILGGNDNTDDSHPLDDGSAFHLPLSRDMGRLDLVARHDVLGDQDWWVLFNRATGAKIRMKFPVSDDIVKEDREEPPYRRSNTNAGAIEVTKGATPELVDIKVTDFCPFGCEYCYQGSTTAGEHAPIEYIRSVIAALAKMEVFEAAIGGGEPTLHPHFVPILKEFRAAGIVPNFTTKNFQWMRDDELRPQILDPIGGFALSCESSADVDKMLEYAARYQIPLSKITIQVIPQILSHHSLKTILETCAAGRIRCTLLGYKDNGRGAEFRSTGKDYGLVVKPSKGSDWLAVVAELKEEQGDGWRAPRKVPALSVDTVLAAQDAERIEAAGIHQVMYHTEDGNFSMYIDAVTRTMGPSSYCDPQKMIPIRSENVYRGMTEEMVNQFLTW